MGHWSAQFCGRCPDFIRSVTAFTLLVLCAGCAHGVFGEAPEPCSDELGGPAPLLFSYGFRQSLGPRGIDAASKTLGDYLVALPGSIGEGEIQVAITRVMEGAEKAKQGPLTVSESRELEERVRFAIGAYEAQCKGRGVLYKMA